MKYWRATANDIFPLTFFIRNPFAVLIPGIVHADKSGYLTLFRIDFRFTFTC